jgi:hypothetical protein
MGLDVSGHTILGVQVERSDFWIATGEERFCGSCGRKGTVDERFCSKDGRELYKRAIEKPTENFAKYAATIGEDVQLWGRWNDHPTGLGIWRCDGLQGSGVKGVYPLALGFRLGRTDSHRSGEAGAIVAFDLDALPPLIAQIRQTALALGLSGALPVRIFTCVYLSY